ncbi:hypothetical protein HDU81_005722 [Chytriomyces hyalinus]|nr:hypothetical protein HDU81_005722 [Chytriomyces hyalinus]
MLAASAACTPGRRPPPGGYSSIVLGTTPASLPPSQKRSNLYLPSGPANSSPSISRRSKTLVSNVVFGDDTTHATKEAVASRKQKKPASADSSRANSPHTVSGILPTARFNDLSLKSALTKEPAESVIFNDGNLIKTGCRLVPSRKKSSLTFGLMTKTIDSDGPVSTHLQRVSNENKPRELKACATTIETKSNRTHSTVAATLKTQITPEKNKSSIVFGDCKQSVKEMTRPSKASYSGHLNRTTIAIGYDTTDVKKPSVSNLRAPASSLADFAGFGGAKTATRISKQVSSPMQGAAGVSSGKHRVY